MDFTATQIGILLGGLFPILLLSIGVWMAWRRKVILLMVLLGATLVHEGLLVTYPLWYDVLSDFALEGEMTLLVAPDLLMRVAMAEGLYVGLFMFPIILYLLFRKRVPPQTIRNVRGTECFERFLLCAGLAISLATFLRPGEDYETVIQHAEIVTNVGLLEKLYGWFRGFFALPSLIMACLYVSKRDARMGWRIVGGVIVLLVVAYGLAAGLRGRLTWVISLLLIGAILYKQWRVVVVAISGAILLLPIAQYLGGGWRSVTLNDLGGESQTAALERLYKVIKEGEAHSEENGTFARMLARRAQGPRNSALLYKWYDEGRGCGWQPIISSLVAVVPRAIWPGKGVGGSSDETPYGAATFMVRRIGYDAPIYNMGPILASAHAYWEGGYLFLILSGLGTGALWVVVIRIAQSSRIEIGALYVLLLAGSLLIDGFFTALFPVYSYILMLYNTVFGLLMVHWIMKMSFKGNPFNREEPVNG